MQLFVLRPLQFATGLYSRKLLPKSPSMGLMMFCYVYWLTFFLARFSDTIPNHLEQVVVIVFSIVLLPTRWRIPLLLGWAALDVVDMLTGWHSDFWNWALLALAALRSFSKE